MKEKKVAALQAKMAEHNIDAYLITSADAHASEYTAPFWRVREWVSGFTGSAGVLIVLRDEAGLWTDGRYFIQAENELKNTGIDLYRQGEKDVPTPWAFLAKKMPQAGTLCYDERTIMYAESLRMKEALAHKEIVHMHNADFFTTLWTDRPELPADKVFVHEPPFADKPPEKKLAEVRTQMAEQNIEAYLVTALDSIAWLTNLRGSDIPCTPVFYAYALITQTDAHIFIDTQKLPPNVLLPGFTIHPYDSLLENLCIANKIHFNPSNTSVKISNRIKTPEPLTKDIISLLKAVKTPAEISNIKNAFVKEGVVLTKTLFWLEDAIADGQPITEGDVARKISELRKTQPHFLYESFPTICAYGANAAQAHYSCGEKGETLQPSGFLLIDTGGQYLDGTTDTTRTIALGALTHEMKRDFTLVLKGNLALSHAIFPLGTTGSALDILARQHLWANGQNYRHGTGHGIGYCLSVHEGPHNISGTHNAIALTPGMLTSNEPAYYKPNEYGIRIENIIYVKEHEKTLDGNFLSFGTLTLCPIDTRAILPEMLSPEELARLNAYHACVFEALSPHLPPAERTRLKQATTAIQ
jgi:Xaa-Pro aminopeptidase